MHYNIFSARASIFLKGHILLNFNFLSFFLNLNQIIGWTVEMLSHLVTLSLSALSHGNSSAVYLVIYVYLWGKAWIQTKCECNRISFLAIRLATKLCHG